MEGVIKEEEEEGGMKRRRRRKRKRGEQGEVGRKRCEERGGG